MGPMRDCIGPRLKSNKGSQGALSATAFVTLPWHVYHDEA